MKRWILDVLTVVVILTILAILALLNRVFGPINLETNYYD